MCRVVCALVRFGGAYTPEEDVSENVHQGLVSAQTLAGLPVVQMQCVLLSGRWNFPGPPAVALAHGGWAQCSLRLRLCLSTLL